MACLGLRSMAYVPVLNWWEGAKGVRRGVRCATRLTLRSGGLGAWSYVMAGTLRA